MATRKRELVYRDGKPAAVILDIAEYEELLERAEDLDDLRITGARGAHIVSPVRGHVD